MLYIVIKEPIVEHKVLDLTVTRKKGLPSCPYCWDEVTDERICNRCGAAAHKECVKDMGLSKKCPTAGCGGKLKKVRV
jgi:predicted amidophosphoribosyltransferase